MVTINALIEMINSNEITVSQAVDVAESENMEYEIKYFSPSSKSELPYWEMKREWDRRRKSVIEPHATNQKAHSAPKKEGQLWEQCDCGNEPVYAPLHLCASCWPEIDQEDN